MNLKDISLQISRIPSAIVLGAYDKFVEAGTVVTKQQAVTALAEEVMAGNIVTDDIKDAPPLSQRTTAPTTSTIDQAIVQATATVASRAESNALSALNRIEDMDQRVHHMDDALTDITQALDKLSRQANASLDTSVIHSQVTKAIADAFKPFAEAVNASGAQAVIGNMVSVTKIDCLPCVDVFGVDVRDMKGRRARHEGQPPVCGHLQRTQCPSH